MFRAICAICGFAGCFSHLSSPAFRGCTLAAPQADTTYFDGRWPFFLDTNL